VEVRETHISWVFLAGEFAYKLKKPLVLDFLDYGTPERRRAMGEEELRLNRRLASDLYLAVRGTVTPSPPPLALPRRWCS
jgi:aminoglycoside phosphotransferase family enzyme